MYPAMSLGLTTLAMLAFLSASNEAGRQFGDESGVLWHFGTGG
jgi:hypothetical protein